MGERTPTPELAARNAYLTFPMPILLCLRQAPLRSANCHPWSLGSYRRSPAAVGSRLLPLTGKIVEDEDDCVQPNIMLRSCHSSFRLPLVGSQGRTAEPKDDCVDWFCWEAWYFRWVVQEGRAEGRT